MYRYVDAKWRQINEDEEEGIEMDEDQDTS